MRISVVVPTYNRRETLVRTLQTLFRQDFPADAYEVVVVVDGSTDGTAARLRELSPGCGFHVIEQNNLGPSAARNTGLRAARGEIVVFVDDDMCCEQRLLRAFADALDGQSQAVCMGAFLLSTDSPRTLASDCHDLELGAFHLKYREYPGLVMAGAAFAFGLSAARRDELLRTGGFDERFRMREDAEFAYRLSTQGFRVLYVPSALAYQFYDKPPKRLLRDAEAFAVADAMMLRVHPEFSQRSEFGRLLSQTRGKRALRNLLAITPLVTDAALTALWSAAGALAPTGSRLWRLGVRALQWHRGLVWYRGMLREMRRNQAIAVANLHSSKSE